MTHDTERTVAFFVATITGRISAHLSQLTIVDWVTIAAGLATIASFLLQLHKHAIARGWYGRGKKRTEKPPQKPNGKT